MWVRIGLATLLVGASASAWYTGLYDHASHERLEELLSQAGLLGPVVFIGLFVLGELIQIPSVLFVFGAGMVWPLHIALPTAYLGALCAATVAFIVARQIVSDTVHKRIPDRFRHYEERLATHGLRTVIVIRLVLFLLPVMHWVLGASRVRFRDVLLGTAIGILPGVVFLVVVGDGLAVHWNTIPVWVWVSGGFIAVPLIWRLQRWQMSHASKAAHSGPHPQPSPHAGRGGH